MYITVFEWVPGNRLKYRVVCRFIGEWSQVIYLEERQD